MAKQQARVEVLEKKVSDLEVKVASQEATINSLAKEAKSFKEMANTRDQGVRGNAIRLFGLLVSPVTQEWPTCHTEDQYPRINSPHFVNTFKTPIFNIKKPSK
jgi:hypothetical protein